MKYFLVAGEASGDLHGGHLIEQIKKMDEEADFCFWGGEKMQAAAGQKGKLDMHYKSLAAMGFWEVLIKIFSFLELLKKCKNSIDNYYPDVLVLIDFPGFNLKIAQFAKEKGFRVVYYISPKIWAWGGNRIHQIKKNIHKMMCILPFEKDFYTQNNFKDEVFYVGNPIVDAVDIYQKTAKTKTEICKIHQLDPNKKKIILLPGSRKQEVKKHLKIMLQGVKKMSDYEILIAGAPHMQPKNYEKLLQKFPQAHWISEQTYDLLKISDLAVVKSGTSTLETLLFKVPQVVVYKVNFLSYWIGKMLIKVKYISLVNLIAGQKIIPELIQNAMNKKNIAKNLILLNQNRQEILQNYEKCIEKLGSSGASYQAARIAFFEALLIHNNRKK